MFIKVNVCVKDGVPDREVGTVISLVLAVVPVVIGVVCSERETDKPEPREFIARVEADGNQVEPDVEGEESGDVDGLAEDHEAREERKQDLEEKVDGVIVEDRNTHVDIVLVVHLVKLV